MRQVSVSLRRAKLIRHRRRQNTSAKRRPVADKVANVFESKAGNIFLNFGARYPNQVFTAFIPKDSADQFPNAMRLEGQTISVTGKIVLYRGKPEIVLDDPSMLKNK